VTPSVTTPGATNLSDATVIDTTFRNCEIKGYNPKECIKRGTAGKALKLSSGLQTLSAAEGQRLEGKGTGRERRGNGEKKRGDGYREFPSTN